MGEGIKIITPTTPENRSRTIELALQEANARQTLADTGYFDQDHRTCDIEHEVRVINGKTGNPSDATEFFRTNTIGARPDTTSDNVEYDANGATPLTDDGIRHLHTSFVARTRYTQDAIRRIDPDAILVPIGTQPFVKHGEWEQHIVRDEGKKARYRLMEEQTASENPSPQIRIEHPETGKVVVDKATNLAAMTRASGTQFHISERTPAEAIEAHNISIAIAPVMIALFANSPFAAGVDTGRASNRIEMLRQGEQLRAGLPEPAESLKDYYEKQLMRAAPPFMEVDDPAKALDLSMGAIHTVSRIIVDTKHRTIRNEYRHIDSQPPYKSIQAFLLTLGLVDGLKGQTLPEFAESQRNFDQSVWGLQAKMTWKGEEITAQELGLRFIELAQQTLSQMGLGNVSEEFLTPLKREVTNSESQAEMMRRNVRQAMQGGASSREALLQALHVVNRQALEGK